MGQKTDSSTNGHAPRITDEAGGHFQRFGALVKNGWLAALSPMALKVLLAIEVHANREGIAWPGGTRLAKYLGHANARHVRRARKELEQMGWLQVQKSGGGRVLNIYQITIPTTPPPETPHRGRKSPPGADPAPGPKPSRQRGRKSPRQQGPKSPPHRGPKSPPQRGRNSPPELLNELLNDPPTNNSPTTSAGLGGGGVEVDSFGEEGGGSEERARLEDLADFLTRVGIRGKKRKEILQTVPGLTARCAEEKWREIGLDGGGLGLLIETLLTDGEQLVEEWEESERFAREFEKEAAQKAAKKAEEQAARNAKIRDIRDKAAELYAARKDDIEAAAREVTGTYFGTVDLSSLRPRAMAYVKDRFGTPRNEDDGGAAESVVMALTLSEIKTIAVVNDLDAILEKRRQRLEKVEEAKKRKANPPAPPAPPPDPFKLKIERETKQGTAFVATLSDEELDTLATDFFKQYPAMRLLCQGKAVRDCPTIHADLHRFHGAAPARLEVTAQ